MVLDTGVILPFSFYALPTSKKKVIELLLDNFDVYIPKKVVKEMERPIRRLQDQWDEISLTWGRVEGRFNKEDPPNSCLDHIVTKSGKRDLTRIPAEFDVIALGLFLSRSKNSLIFLATHEKDAFMLFNALSRKEQIGYIFSPFDILLFAHIYLGVTFEDADYVWRALIDFPNMNIDLPLQSPVSYSSSLEICFRGCQTRQCARVLLDSGG